MKKFSAFKLSRKEAAQVLGGTGNENSITGPSKGPRPVEEPTAERCALLGCDLCYSTVHERHYCCRCKPK